MKKIASLYQRNYEGDRLIRDEVVPGSEWVLNGEGIATVKIDGTCCLVQNGQLYKRYNAKKGKIPPANFVPAQPEADPVTGHWPGWVPVGDGPEDQYHREAWEATRASYQERGLLMPDWTYELVGPKVQGNPYEYSSHILYQHGGLCWPNVPTEFDDLREFLRFYNRMEGIVWWRDINDIDCDKVKIKRKDFGFPFPVVEK
jgi:hypothetical protein